MSTKEKFKTFDDIVFSVFDGIYSLEREWEIPILKLHEKTRISPELKKATKEVRECYAKQKLAEARLKDLENRNDSDPKEIAAAREEAKKRKKDTDIKKGGAKMITVYAYFDKGRRKDLDPHTFNNLILTDIDHISEEQINELMPKIKKLPFVVFACRSIRGEGIHILNCVEVEGGVNDENLKNVFNATTRLVECDLNIEADKAVGTISRGMLLNHDEQAYYNPEATPLDINTAVLLEKIDINDLKFQEMTEKEKLAAYLDAAKTNLSWSDGNRHSTIVSLASTLNKAGFDLDDVVSECTSRYVQSGFDIEEIESTIRDVYHRYSSQHGTNRKSQQPNKDNGTKGHKDIVQDNNDDFVDEDEILQTKCPEADDVRDLIPDYFWDYIIPKNRDNNTRFVVLISFFVAVGAIFRKVRCLVRPNEIATGKLFYIVSGPAASGKSCIGRAYEIFRIHADKIESESQEEVQKGKEAYKNWKMCLKKCKEEDCGCGAEPVIPEQIRIKLSLNISSSKLIHQMGHNLDFPSLLYTTELDSNLDMKDNPLTSPLRAGYEGEPISSHTHMHGDVSVDKTSMAILAAGTPAQLVNFLKNKENGLASRILISYLPESGYRKLVDEYNMDYDTYMAQKEAFKGRAQTFSQYATNAKLTFELTTKSQQAIDACVEEITKRYAIFGSDELTGFIWRSVKMNVNMAIVLTTFGLYEKGISTGRHAIPDEIIDKVLCWIPYFIEQHIRLLSDLPDTPINKDSNEIKYAHIFSKLPCDFTFAEACNIFSKHVDVSTKTVQRVLKKWVKAGKLSSAQKHYFRTDCSEIHTVA